MKLQYISDLHLEFLDNYNHLIDFPFQIHGDILIIAGDLLPLRDIERHRPFFKQILKPYKKVFWLPGNHEYYRSQMKPNQGDRLYEQIEENVYLVDNYAEVVGNTKLIFSTLWSDISPQYADDIEFCMNDFHVIKTNEGHCLDISYYNFLHQKSVDFIKKETQNLESIEKTIVITHHVPTFENYPEEYIGSELNSAFATELSELIQSSQIDYWIYGHHHRNVPDFKIGKTRLITNQLGYIKRKENKHFSWNKTIDI